MLELVKDYADLMFVGPLSLNRHHSAPGYAPFWPSIMTNARPVNDNYYAMHTNYDPPAYGERLKATILSMAISTGRCPRATSLLTA